MSFALQVLSLFALITCGYVARKRRMVSAQGTSDLAHLATGMIYPALVFVSMLQLSAEDLLANALMPVLVMVIAFIGFGLGLIAVRFLGRVPPETSRAFLFHCLINNYMFLPLPMVLFLYGERGVALLVYSSLGYELIVWTLGVFLFTGQNEPLSQRIRRVISPPFIALLAGITFVLLRDLLSVELRGLAAALSESLLFVARTLGQGTVAVAVIVAGSRFAVLKPQTMLGWRIWLLSVIRLVFVPLAFLPLVFWLPLESSARGILVIIAVMPSAITSIIFSERYGGDSEFIAGGLLMTHLWALITVPLFLAWVL